MAGTENLYSKELPIIETWSYNERISNLSGQFFTTPSPFWLGTGTRKVYNYEFFEGYDNYGNFIRSPDSKLFEFANEANLWYSGYPTSTIVRAKQDLNIDISFSTFGQGNNGKLQIILFRPIETLQFDRNPSLIDTFYKGKIIAMDESEGATQSSACVQATVTLFKGQSIGVDTTNILSATNGTMNMRLTSLPVK
jgi:hypothetical protein